ncbi:MAG TPA: hypothetical protein VJM50_08015 [Pyrinomonadaceae bacterium]|nr:hypothetical protein [Pyrinomonadaceae bacterium]
MRFEKPWEVRPITECIFYHTMDIPGHGIVQGEWDLRSDISRYLGGVSLTGKKVLEIGPASGFVTFCMERMGAEVVAVEIDEHVVWDVVPFRDVNAAKYVEDRRTGMRALKSGFWLAHKAHCSQSKVVYGNIYELPEELGQYDIGVLGLVLLHLRDPLLALEKCAAHVETIIVTEILHSHLVDSPVCQLLPSVENQIWDTWWALSPRLVVQYLGVLGFRKFDLTRHTALYKGQGYPLYTIVATDKSTCY